MLAAVFFSLLGPAIEVGLAGHGARVSAAAAVVTGMLSGAAALALIHRMVPHEHFAMGREGPEALHVRRLWLFVLAVPVACVAWTVTHEEIFREPREYCQERSRSGRHLLTRKFFYLFTCEYCFSHYVTIFFIALTNFRLLIDDWRGYVLAFFALVLVANMYLNLYARLRVDITSEKKDIERKEKEIEHKEKELEKLDVELEQARGKG